MSHSPEFTETAAEAGRLRVMLCRVQLCVLLALLWKIQFFVRADAIYHRFLLSDPFFPDWLESPGMLRVAYLTAVFCAVVTVLFTGRNAPARSAGLVGVSVAQWLAITVMLLHQGSYNDMTFVTAWWTVLWCLWLASQMGRADAVVTGRRAARLACVMLSMVMLGAAVGKWSQEYWSGTVLYEIYFRDRDFWLFNLMRARLNEAQLHQAAVWHSRVVIVIESLAGVTLWCLPPRLAGGLALLVMLAIPLFNNFLLLSVTLSLIGLAWAAMSGPWERPQQR